MRALIIEHGIQGSGGYIKKAIHIIDADMEIVQTDPHNANKLITSERFDLIVVDEGDNHQAAVTETSKLPGVLRVKGGIPVLFVVDDSSFSNGATLDDKRWIVSSRDELRHGLLTALHPDYREIFEGGNGI